MHLFKCQFTANPINENKYLDGTAELWVGFISSKGLQSHLYLAMSLEKYMPLEKYIWGIQNVLV